VLAQGLDLALRQQKLDRLARERAVEAQAVREDRRCDHLVLGHLSHELVVRGLVEKHEVVHLLLRLSLGPLLLLALATSHGGTGLLLLGLLYLRRLLLLCVRFHGEGGGKGWTFVSFVFLMRCF